MFRLEISEKPKLRFCIDLRIIKTNIKLSENFLKYAILFMVTQASMIAIFLFEQCEMQKNLKKRKTF